MKLLIDLIKQDLNNGHTVVVNLNPGDKEVIKEDQINEKYNQTQN